MCVRVYARACCSKHFAHTKNTFSVYFPSVARDVWKSGFVKFVRVSRSIPSRGRPHACWHYFFPSRRRPVTCLLWRCLQRSHGNGSCDQSVVRRAPGNSGRSRCVSNRIVFPVTPPSFASWTVILSVFLRTLTVRRSAERTIRRNAKRGDGSRLSEEVTRANVTHGVGAVLYIYVFLAFKKHGALCGLEFPGLTSRRGSRR